MIDPSAASTPCDRCGRASEEILEIDGVTWRGVCGRCLRRLDRLLGWGGPECGNCGGHSYQLSWIGVAGIGVLCPSCLDSLADYLDGGGEL